MSILTETHLSIDESIKLKRADSGWNFNAMENSNNSVETTFSNTPLVGYSRQVLFPQTLTLFYRFVYDSFVPHVRNFILSQKVFFNQKSCGKFMVK